jgi:hypothetical protein
MSSTLKSLIDTSDLEAALLNDADGEFYKNVTSYLQTWKTKVAQHLTEGVSREDFSRLNRLAEGIETAEKVINFFVKMKPANTTGQS